MNLNQTMQHHSLPYKNRRRAKSLRKSALLRPTNNNNPYLDPSTAAGGGGVGSSGRLSIPLGSPLASDDDGLSTNTSSILMMRRSSSSSSSSRNYANTALWGWILLIITWIVFVVGMGSVLGVWDWAWYGSEGRHMFVPLGGGGEMEEGREGYNSVVIDDEDDELPIAGYYPSLIILSGIMAWVWVLIAWVGMKYFKHAKIHPTDGVDR